MMGCQPALWYGGLVLKASWSLGFGVRLTVEFRGFKVSGGEGRRFRKVWGLSKGFLGVGLAALCEGSHGAHLFNLGLVGFRV